MKYCLFAILLMSSLAINAAAAAEKDSDSGSEKEELSASPKKELKNVFLLDKDPEGVYYQECPQKCTNLKHFKRSCGGEPKDALAILSAKKAKIDQRQKELESEKHVLEKWMELLSKD